MVCKTGYGIVSECIRHGIRLDFELCIVAAIYLLGFYSTLFTDRPGFIEHASMARAFLENVSSEEVMIDEVLPFLYYLSHYHY